MIQKKQQTTCLVEMDTTNCLLREHSMENSKDGPQPGNAEVWRGRGFLAWPGQSSLLLGVGRGVS